MRGGKLPNAAACAPSASASLSVARCYKLDSFYTGSRAVQAAAVSRSNNFKFVTATDRTARERRLAHASER